MTGPWEKYGGASARGPDGMTTAERIAAAKAGTLQVSPERMAAQREIDDRGETKLRDPGILHSAIAGLNQGTMLGWGDEIAARIVSMHPEITYEEALASARGTLDAARDARPVLTYGSEIGGAILAPGAAAAGRAAMAPASLGGRVAAGAATGAVQGGIYGAGTAEEGSRRQGAVVGGVIGGAAGAAVPLAIRGAEGVANAVRSRKAAGQVAAGLGVSRSTARLASDAIGADDAAQMAANIRAAGPNAMLADAGPSVQGALDAAMQRPGAAARIGTGRIEDRAARSLTRINSTLDDLLGAPQGAETTKAAIRTGSAGARRTTYEAAYASAIDYSSDAGRGLEALLPRIPAKTINDANQLMKMNGHVSGQIMASIADDGSVTFTRLPDVRQWDYIKRALENSAMSTEGQGALGAQTSMGRAFQGLARNVRDGLKDAVPAYGDALDTAADAIQRVQGVDKGYGFLSARTTREAARDMLDGLTGPQRAAVRQGVRDYIDDTLANVRAVVSDSNLDAREARKALSELTSRASRVKMRMLLGSDADKLFEALDEAGHALGLRAAVAQNSKTAGRLAHAERVKDLTEPGVVRNAASGKPVRATQTALGALAGNTPEAVARRSDRINSELVELLTRPGQQHALNALAQIGFPGAHPPVAPYHLPAGATNALGMAPAVAAPGSNALVGWSR